MKRTVLAFIQDNSTGEKRCLLGASVLDFGQWTGHFYPPGGGVAEGRTDEETLRLKLLEELDLRLTRSVFLKEVPGDVSDLTIAWYACDVAGEIHRNPESLVAAGFYTVEEIKQLPLWPATKAFLEEFFLRK